MPGSEHQMPLPLDLIESELRSGAPGGRSEPAWLAASRTDPQFWAELLRAQAERVAAPARSTLAGGYDLFHDALVRHAAREAAALAWYDAARGWRELTFGELAASAGARARAWREAGALPGEAIAIARPFGAEAIASLLAAWKLGLVPSIVTPRGSGWLRRRLDRLGAARVDCAAASVPLLGAWRSRRVPPAPDAPAAGATLDASHRYRAGSVALRLLDAAGAAPDAPVDVTADALFLGAVRDGLVGLGLRPGAGALAAGVAADAAGPALLLACLVNAAPYAHLDAADVARDPGLLAARRARALVVGVPAREAVLRTPVDLHGRFDAWYRDAGESSDAASWSAFLAAARLEDAFAGAVRWSAAHGGLALFSPRAKGHIDPALLPVAGVRAAVLGADGAEALTGAGTLALATPGGGAPVATELVVAKRAGALVIAGLRHPGRGGETYPAAEVLAAASGVAEGARASLCDVPSADGHVFDLLLFTGTAAVDVGELQARVAAAVAAEVGREWLPDHVAIFPLSARVKDGAVDHAWCREHYLSGGLTRRSRSAAQAAVARVRGALGLAH